MRLNNWMNDDAEQQADEDDHHAQRGDDPRFKSATWLHLTAGMFVWRLAGLLSRLSASISSALMMRNRVAAGLITSSM